MAVKVGSVVVIENDAKINWNKIKGAPAIPNAVLNATCNPIFTAPAARQAKTVYP